MGRSLVRTSSTVYAGCTCDFNKCQCISRSFVSVPMHLPLICVSAIASPAHLCQCHCISRSFVSVPLHLPLICVSAIASPSHLCQCHCISRSFVSVPLQLPLICVSAIASPTHLCQCHCISCSVMPTLHIALTCVSVIDSPGIGTNEWEIQWH